LFVHEGDNSLERALNSVVFYHFHYKKTNTQQVKDFIMAKNGKNSNNLIKKIDVTSDSITGRGGITLFSRYTTQNTRIYELMKELFSDLRKNRKGMDIDDIFRQVFC